MGSMAEAWYVALIRASTTVCFPGKCQIRPTKEKLFRRDPKSHVKVPMRNK